MVHCQNTASCPGAFYTLHDVTSQDFRVGLRWMLPAGGFGFGGSRAAGIRSGGSICAGSGPAICACAAPAIHAGSGAAIHATAAAEPRLIRVRPTRGRTDCMNRMKERAMRWVSAILLILLLILGMASPALAADYDLPILRGSSQPPAPVVTVGPATFTRWSGFYFGGNVSLGSATSDFSTATRPLVQFSLQHTTVESSDHPSDFQVLGRGSAVAAGGGAFLGYNTQWQDLILGVEATYTHVNLNTTASSVPNGVGRFFPDVNTAVNVSAQWQLGPDRLWDRARSRGICHWQLLALRLPRHGGGASEL